MLKTIKTKLKIFFESRIFMLIISIITVLCWAFKLDILSYVFFAISIILIEFSMASYVSLPSIILLLFGGNRGDGIPIKTPLGIAFIVLMSIGFILMLFNFFKNFKTNIKKLKDSMILSLSILAIVMLISVINSPVKGTTLVYVLTFSLNILITILMLTRIDTLIEKREFIIFSFILVLFTISTEVVIRFFELYENNNAYFLLSNKLIHLGWRLSNHYIIIINIAVILSAYQYMKTENIFEKLLALIAIVLGYALNGILMCRGSMLGMGICAIPLLIIYFIYTKNWKREIPYILLMLVVIAGSIIFINYSNTAKQCLEKFINNGSDLNGRKELYELAKENFKKHLFIGTGAGSSAYYIKNNFPWNPVNNYHNVFYQMTTCGILGLIALAIYLFAIVKRLFKKDLLALILFVIFLYFMIHGQVDTLFFNRKVMPFFTIAILLLPNIIKNDETIKTSN